MENKNKRVIILELVFDIEPSKMSEVEKFILEGFRKQKPELAKDAYWVSSFFVGDERLWKIKFTSDTKFIVAKEYLSDYTGECSGAKKVKGNYIELRSIDKRLKQILLPDNFNTKTEWANKIKFNDEAIVLIGGPGNGKRYAHGTLKEIFKGPLFGNYI